MNHHSRRQHHEQARKRHRHEQQQYARAVARKPREMFPAWLLTAGIGAMLVVLLAVAFAR
jgi:hypothetical protein